MLRFSVKTWLSLVALSLLSCSIGCPKASSGLVQVTGKVMVDGKPAEGASVMFFPAPPGEPTTIAAGVVDGAGQFTLVTNLEPGINPGKYNVTVIWPEPSPKESKTFSMSKRDPPDLLKSKYADPKKTTLSAEVTTSTTEIPPFELSIK